MPETSTTQRQRRRSRNEPQADVERFIVPLIAREVRALLEQRAAVAPADRRVLDIGCGGQPFRAELEDLGYNYASMDVPGSVPVPDYVGRIDSPLEGALTVVAPFDLLLCTEVLEHVPDWAQAFNNLTALVRPGGTVILTTPHIYLLHEEPRDYWRPTPHAFRWYAEKVGLKVESLKRAGTIWDVLGTVTAVGSVAPTDDSLRARLLASMINLVLGWLRPRLQDKCLSRYCQWQAPFYLSTVVVLSKPGP